MHFCFKGSIAVLLSLESALVAVAILFRTSFSDLPSLFISAPRYLNVLTSSSTSAFKETVSVVNASFLFLSLVVRVLVFSVLIFIPRFDATTFSLFATICNSLRFDVKRSISSANLRLHSFLPPIEIVGSNPSRALSIISSRKMLKRVGDRSQPWRTMTVVSNHSLKVLLMRTALVESLYRVLMTSIKYLSMFFFSIICQRVVCHTLSNAFLISKKQWWIPFCCSICFSHSIRRLKICSAVLLFFLKPACSSEMIASAWGVNLLRMTFSITLLAVLMRLIVRLLVQSFKLPF